VSTHSERGSSAGLLREQGRRRKAYGSDPRRPIFIVTRPSFSGVWVLARLCSDTMTTWPRRGIVIPASNVGALIEGLANADPPASPKPRSLPVRGSLCLAAHPR